MPQHKKGIKLSPDVKKDMFTYSMLKERFTDASFIDKSLTHSDGIFFWIRFIWVDIV